MRLPALALSLSLVLAPAASALPDGFGGKLNISSLADAASSVHAADLDGDGDLDVLSASAGDDKVAWYENLGGGEFGPQQIITTDGDGARSVFAIDLDGDSDPDVLSAAHGIDGIAWNENLGGGTFGTRQVITSAVDQARSVYAADLDGDGDPDVLSASFLDDKVAWYENLGGGSFGPQQVLSLAVDGPNEVFAIDLDGDGDVDVLSSSYLDASISWFENLGGGTFTTEQDVANQPWANSVHAADLDGDGDADVLAGSGAFSPFSGEVAWHENLGGGTFGPEQVLSFGLHDVRCVRAGDLDGDGDIDVVATSYDDHRVAWYENLGGGSFGPQEFLSDWYTNATGVHVADLDGDGDNDLVGASHGSDLIAWWRYYTCTEATFCAQTKPTSIPGCTPTLTMQDCSIDKGVWTTYDLPRDESLGDGTIVGVYIYTSGYQSGQSAVSMSVPFGTLCLSGFHRSGPALLPGAIGGTCNPGPLSLEVADLTLWGLFVGGHVNVQLWYRDPTPTDAGNANLTNAIFYVAE